MIYFMEIEMVTGSRDVVHVLLCSVMSYPKECHEHSDWPRTRQLEGSEGSGLVIRVDIVAPL
jgi:hypothetical protein